MATDARIGAELAGYRIEAPIGRGGMGIVYRAEHLRLGRKVALKLLAPELAENQGFRARFEHESRLAAALDHPNIVPLFEAGEADGLLFIAMRYVEGTDLRALLNSHGRLEPERALAIAGQVGSALDAAHIRGLVHRDVKPGNILIAADPGIDVPEHCYLTDFGLTKDTSSPVELTATGTFVGTIDYIAPEQIEGAKPDGRGDQYALACVLYECLTGHPPFPRDEEIVVMWAHLQDEPPTVTAARPDLPPAIDAVIAQAMAKSPKERFTTCTAMVAAARDALMPGTIAPADVTRAHASPVPPADVTRVGAANVAPPLAAPAPAAPPLAAPAPGPNALRPPAAPPAPRDASARRRPLLILGALAVVAAAVAGALAGQGGDKATPTAAKTASNADLDLQYKAPWAPGGSAGAVPGLTLTRPITLRAGDGSIVAGRIAKPGPGLLPAGMTASATDTVSLGSTPAFRHQGVGAKAAAPATVFVVPTDHGPRGHRLRRRRNLALRGRGGDAAPARGRRARGRARSGLRRRPREAVARPERARAQRPPRAGAGRDRRGAGPHRGLRRPRPGRAGRAGAPAGPRHGPRRQRRGGRRDRRDRTRLQEPRRGGPQAGRGPLPRRERRAAPGARGPRARDQRAEAARLQRPARCMRCRHAS